ncbi:WD40 repeat domain-containing protein [Roseiconus lacunae]|uniref:WD40 repeat domain-containing protein n=1 Tax=Roseiconus lacunae TaxID=2605694 RepID=A0ABT7PDJ9_9BACT|nr:WD40 repeat domain-containing protein [Roseiconus lacunae]MDM4014359.1 WD40 repeat domain-containing protein [Roseiconus lacunae]WRQ49673.1 WD40 repeat domain-containing protein [Stieleria sp. HD01]
MRRFDQASQLTLNRRQVAGLALGGTLLRHPWLAAADDATNASGASFRPQTPVSTTVRLQPVSADFDGAIIQAIAVDPAGKILAVAGDDHGIRILDAVSMRRIALLTGHSDLIQSVQFDPSGRRLVSAGNDGDLVIWDCRDWSILQRMPTSHAFAGVRFAPRGQELAAVGFTDEVFIISQQPIHSQPRVRCDCTDLRSVEYRQDGKVVAVAGRTGKLHLFQRGGYQLIDEFTIHSGRTHDMKFVGSTSILASIGEDGGLTLFDTDSKQVVRQVNVTRGKLYAICLIDEKYAAVAGSDNLISLVDIATGNLVERLTGHSGTVTSLAAIGTTLYSGGYDATLRKWQLESVLGGAERIAERDNALER